VSHDPTTVATFCNRALLLDGGRIIMNGDAEKVAAAYVRVASSPAEDGAFG